ncbi:MAG: hypothetical protein OXU20_26840 [Myxococcales bacterium]|nr:hypothetical protein [Myxococcales bacterium]
MSSSTASQTIVSESGGTDPYPSRPLGLLKTVLIFKITVTIFAWALPFLLLPPSWLHVMVGPVPEPIMTLRLLGWAYVALVAGYTSGLVEVMRGRLPWGILVMGLVSNGGATLLLAVHLLVGEGAELRGVPALTNWLSCFSVAFITAGLSTVAARACGRH